MLKPKEFTIVQKLINSIQSKSNIYSEIAYYILLQYNNIDSLTVNQICKNCFTSPSTIRRFCQSIGYQNFTDLKRAKNKNPENQQIIAKNNWEKGRYNPHFLLTEVNSINLSVYRNSHPHAIKKLAQEIAINKSTLLFCVRPYSFVLQEFQNQMMIFGKSVYIFDEIYFWRSVIEKMEDDFCSIIISPAATLIPVIGNELENLPGKKTLIACKQYLSNPEYHSYLNIYDLIIPLRSNAYDYDYLEIYGKYAVSFLFELIMSEIFELMFHQS